MKIQSNINWAALKVKKTEWILARKIIKYWKRHKKTNPEVADALNFLRREPFHVVLYKGVHDYKSDNIEVFRESGLPYVIHSGERLYFRRIMDDDWVKILYTSLLGEQDPRSPHCYKFLGYDATDKTVFDVGAAEGIFALDMIKTVKHIHLFECDEEWIEALEATFKTWRDKITVVRKYVGDTSSEGFTTLDDYCQQVGVTPDFIKADIEGAESQMIDGAQKTLAGETVKDVIVCTYHRDQDAELLEKQLAELNYDVKFSKGYMAFIYGPDGYDLKPPYLRKALIHARKKQ